MAKKKAAEASSPLSQAMESDGFKQMEKAEAILVEAAAQERRISVSEYVELRTLAGWGTKEADRHLRKTARRLRLQQVVGTSSDREAFTKKCEADKQRLAEEGDKLREEIAKAQQALSQMERECKQNEKRAEEIESAKQNLSELLPEHVLDTLNEHRRAINAYVRRDLLDTQTELAFLRRLSDPSSYARPSEHAEAVRKQWPALVAFEATSSNDGGNMGEFRLQPAWAEKQQELQSEITKLEADEKLLQEKYDSEMAEIEAARREYWR